MAKTKKVGSTGRFGARYGKTIRKKILEVELKQKKIYKCPKCHYIKLKRLSSGIWNCKKCSIKVAAKAYEI